MDALHILGAIFAWLAVANGNSGESSIKDDFELSDEARLIKMLTTRYRHHGKMARPVRNSSDVMRVQFGLRIISVEINEAEMIMRTSAWVKMRWKDSLLTWNHTEYGGLRVTTMSPDDVWLPDIMLANTARAKIEIRNVDLQVGFDGRVLWAPHQVYNSACLIDVTHFPFDTQRCHLWFQSQARHSAFFNIEELPDSPLDLKTYLKSYQKTSQWEILENRTEQIRRPRDEDVFLKWSRRPSLKFSLVLRRQASFQMYLLLIPCLLMSCLIPAMFCLPQERPDRHMLAMGLFGSSLVLLLILVETAPPSTASIPKLGIYYVFAMSVIMSSIPVSIGVICIGRQGQLGQKVPWIVELIVIKIIGRVLYLRRRTFPPFEQPVPVHHEEAPGQKPVPGSSYEYFDPVGALHYRKKPTKPTKQPSPPPEASSAAMPLLLAHSEPKTKRLVAQWRIVSMILDRFVCMIYLVLVVVFTIVLFPRPQSPSSYTLNSGNSAVER